MRLREREPRHRRAGSNFGGMIGVEKGIVHQPGRPACHASGQPSPLWRSPSSASFRRDPPPLRRPSRPTCACSPPRRRSRSRSSGAARCSSVSAHTWRRWAATSGSTSSRASYRSPIGVTEVIGGQRRALPATVAHGWEGIAGFFNFTVSSASQRRHCVACQELLPERLEPPARGRLRPAHLALPAVLRHQPVHPRLGLGDRQGMGRRARQHGSVGAAAGRHVHREGLARPGVRGHVRGGRGRRVGGGHDPRRARPVPALVRGPARAPHARHPLPAGCRGSHSTTRPLRPRCPT